MKTTIYPKGSRMDVLLQINEIVSGPIKDFLFQASGGGAPQINAPELPELPPLSSPTLPQDVNVEVGGSTFGDLGSSDNGSSQFLNDAGSSAQLTDNSFLNDAGSSDQFNGNEYGSSQFGNDNGSSEFGNDNGSSELFTEAGSSQFGNENDNGSSELFTEAGSSQLLNDAGSAEFGNQAGSSELVNGAGSSELLNGFQSSDLDLSALGSLLGV